MHRNMGAKALLRLYRSSENVHRLRITCSEHENSSCATKNIHERHWCEYNRDRRPGRINTVMLLCLIKNSRTNCCFFLLFSHNLVTASKFGKFVHLIHLEQLQNFIETLMPGMELHIMDVLWEVLLKTIINILLLILLTTYCVCLFRFICLLDICLCLLTGIRF